MQEYNTFIFGCNYIRKFHGWRGCIAVSKYQALLVGFIPNCPIHINNNDNHPLWSAP